MIYEDVLYNDWTLEDWSTKNEYGEYEENSYCDSESAEEILNELTKWFRKLIYLKTKMDKFTPYEEKQILYESLVEAVGAIKAKQILEKNRREYAMIKGISNIEVR